MNRTSKGTRGWAPVTAVIIAAAFFLVGPGTSAAGAQTDAFVVDSTTPGTVTAISTAVPPSHDPVTITVGDKTGPIVISGDGNWAYVGNTGATTVSRIDIRNLTPDAVAFTFDVGGSPTALAVNSNGDDLYVLRDPGVAVAFEHSTSSPSPRGAQVPVGSAFGGLALTAAEPQQLWVAAGTVTVIDASTFATIGTPFAPEKIHDSNVYNFAVGIAVSSDPANPTAFVTYNTYDYSPIRFGARGGIVVVDVWSQAVGSDIPLFSLPGP